MAAPLTIEQMILNHNIGVNLSDAGTFKGKQIEEFSMVGHQHTTADIVSGIFHPDRLPQATTNARGTVTLSTATNSTSQTLAATSSAVNAIRLSLEGKANSAHKHNPSDLETGAFSAQIAAQSNTNYTARQIRNILFGTAIPANNIGQDGDVYLRYE